MKPTKENHEKTYQTLDRDLSRLGIWMLFMEVLSSSQNGSSDKSKQSSYKDFLFLFKI